MIHYCRTREDAEKAAARYPVKNHPNRFQTAEDNQSLKVVEFLRGYAIQKGDFGDYLQKEDQPTNPTPPKPNLKGQTMTFFLKADDGQCYWVHTQVGQGTAKVILEPTRTASESPPAQGNPTPATDQ